MKWNPTRLLSICLFFSSTAGADTINFSGTLDLILVNDGTGTFASAPQGSPVSGFIDDQTFNGEITVDGITESFDCCIFAGGLSVSNDEVLDEETAALLNQLAGSTVFTAGEIVDGVNVEGDVDLGKGQRLEVGVSYLLNGAAFPDDSLSNYPFNNADVRIALFFILEENPIDDVYDALGVFPIPIVDTDNDGIPDNLDNCSATANPSQLDSNADGFGNACDADVDNDCFITFIDFGQFPPAIFSAPGDTNWNPDLDFDGNDNINFLDQTLFAQTILQLPGPSGIANCGFEVIQEK